MSQKIFQLRSYFNYWLDAVDEHSLHSPFLFDFYTNVLKQQSPADDDGLRTARRKISLDHRMINVTDLGAGSARMIAAHRRISDIYRFTTSPLKFSSLFSRIIRHYNFRDVIELGTSVGLNALYLSKASHHVRVTTFEGSPEISEVARSLFRDNGIDNIRLIEGNIDMTLGPYLETVDQFDFALVDANHRFEPTVHYLELLARKAHSHSVIAVDDIHCSAAMERAWRTIQNHQLVHLSIDLFRCGLLFFNPSLTRQNVVLQF